jgi:prepilin-type N-terminal cleavage/methylation domain-containing protein
MKGGNARGYTLAEILIVVALIAVVAAIMIPALSDADTQKVDVAAAEVANALRFALHEADRTGGYVLIDAQTVPGHLRIVKSNAAGADLGTCADPLTKRGMDIDVAGSAFFGQVVLTPRFLQGGMPYAQLLIGPVSQLQVLDGAGTKGALQAGSGIVVSRNGIAVTVAINEVTGRVTLP